MRQLKRETTEVRGHQFYLEVASVTRQQRKTLRWRMGAVTAFCGPHSQHIAEHVCGGFRADVLHRRVDLWVRVEACVDGLGDARWRRFGGLAKGRDVRSTGLGARLHRDLDLVGG